MPTIGTRGNAAARGYGFTGAAAAEVLGGMVLMTPTSIASTGTGNSSSIGANGSVTFSSCATLSLNGVFTSDYDNYMIAIRAKTIAGWPYSFIRLRSAGTDNSTASSYVSQLLRAQTTAVTGARETRTSTSDAFVGPGESAATIYVFGPNLAQPTAFRSVSVLSSSSISTPEIYDNASTHNQSTSYDGFTIIMESSLQMGGLISVYGLGG